MELIVSPSVESSDAAALKGFAETTSNTVDLAKEVFDSLEGDVRVYDIDENFSAPTIAARSARIMAEGA
jgi:hypothetical protein